LASNADNSIVLRVSAVQAARLELTFTDRTQVTLGRIKPSR